MEKQSLLINNFDQYYTQAIANDPILSYIEALGFSIYDWILVFAVAFVGIEMLDDMLKKRMNGRHFMEVLSNFITQIPFYLSEIVVFGFIVFLYFYIYEAIPWKITISYELAIFVLLAADFVYYWEHRAMHRIRLFWLAHSVHHSSPVMNTSTAFRFSFMDPVISGMFHLPLVLCGINPVYIFMGEILVQAYQFWIHNEMIRRLGPLEWIFNTPSHHRVHHGSDDIYVDKNYGGILIIWDRLFGTFQEEKQLPTYGLTTQINSVNPITIQFYEFPKLFRDLAKRKGLQNKFKTLFLPPGWQPEQN